MGLLLFLSLNSLLVCAIPVDIKWHSVPLIGMIFTIISRALDSLENLWAILIYTNPDGYAPWLLPILNITEQLKWIFVALEYSLLLLGLFEYICYRNRKGKSA